MSTEIQRIPTRFVGSGTVTLLAGASQQFVGSNARQDRIQFVVTNLDATQILKLQTLNSTTLATIFPQRCFTLETDADFQVYNPNGNSVQFEVAELYPDDANHHSAAAGGSGPASPPATNRPGWSGAFL